VPWRQLKYLEEGWSTWEGYLSALEDRFEHLGGIRGAIVAAMLAGLWVRNGGWLDAHHACSPGTAGKAEAKFNRSLVRGAGGASSEEAGRDGHGLQPVMAIMKCKEDLVE